MQTETALRPQTRSERMTSGTSTWVEVPVSPGLRTNRPANYRAPVIPHVLGPCTNATCCTPEWAARVASMTAAATV